MAETQTNTVYNKIKARIEDGEYSPAQSLTEAALSQEYGVSRNTIKKALLMLESDGYVTMDLNKGAKVASYSKTEVLQFLELREVLEGFITRLAVPVIAEETIEEMGRLLEQMKVCRDQGELFKYSQCNHAFHEYIFDACPNRTAVEMTQKLKNQMKKYNSKTILIPGRIDRSIEEHTQIYAAICNRDEDAAERYIKKHIHSVRDVFEQYYSLLF